MDFEAMSTAFLGAMVFIILAFAGDKAIGAPVVEDKEPLTRESAWEFCHHTVPLHLDLQMQAPTDTTMYLSLTRLRLAAAQANQRPLFFKAHFLMTISEEVYLNSMELEAMKGRVDDIKEKLISACLTFYPSTMA